MMTPRLYNFKPDLPDFRDHPFEETAAPLPPHVDLRPHCPPVVDQGQIGSCTGNAIAGALGFDSLKSGLPNVYSRLFIYYQERAIEGDVGQDNGAQIRDGVKACATVGACLETVWPYAQSLLFRKPNKLAYRDALPRVIKSYSRVQSLQGLKQALAAGYPVVYGFTVYESFESDAVAHTGVVPMPQPNESVLGGHAVLAVGYDDATQLVTSRNSWGLNWGVRGYFFMPYPYIGNPNLTSDLWVIYK